MGGLASHILRVASLGRTRPQGGEFSPWGPSGSNVGSALRPGYGRPLRKTTREILRHDQDSSITSEPSTAVNAVKLGAVDYLSKPVDADDVVAALLALEGRRAEPPENPMSADRVRWEHIQRIYELCGRNVSETARRLNMHRRTLQRILAKHAPK
jgi:DNA-binding NtrC family response regulator